MVCCYIVILGYVYVLYVYCKSKYVFVICCKYRYFLSFVFVCFVSLFFRFSFCCIFLFFNTFHNNIRTLKKIKHTPHRQTSHTHRKNRPGGGGYTTPQLYGANTPSRKKIKKFQKIKNSNVITYKITHCQN